MPAQQLLSVHITRVVRASSPRVHEARTGDYEAAPTDAADLGAISAMCQWCGGGLIHSGEAVFSSCLL